MKPIDIKFIGILNLSHNSFSDGREYSKLNKAVARFNELKSQGAIIVDVGAQSTAYGVRQIPAEIEWSILAPFLKSIEKKNAISVDTYNYSTAKSSIDEGVGVINDVSAGRDPKMLELIAANRHIKYIAMFSHVVPADKEIRIKSIVEIDEWFAATIKRLENNKIDLNRVILDPGIGFATNAEQSLQVIRDVEKYNKYGVKVLIGHSRKSFLESISKTLPAERDIETLAASIYMFGKVDYLRVHNVEIHARAKAVWDRLNIKI